MMSGLPDKIKEVRKDLSDRVWHFTNRSGSPFETLRSIVNSRKVSGSTDKFCTHRSACFTETPLLESIRQSSILDQYNYHRMSDFGIGFTKDWLFEKGGRPVIYSTSSEKAGLPQDYQWRHCELDYGAGIDFTWQREWRVLGDVDFSQNDDVLIVVTTFADGMELLSTESSCDHKHEELFITLDFPFVTFEQLANANDPLEIVTYTHHGD